MKFNQENLKELAEFARSKFNDVPDTPAMRDKKIHTENVAKILYKITGDKELSDALGNWHDIGRIQQYELFGRFADDKVLHHHLGLNYVEQVVYKGELKHSPELELIHVICEYHGRKKYFPFKEILPEWLEEMIE